MAYLKRLKKPIRGSQDAAYRIERYLAMVGCCVPNYGARTMNNRRRKAAQVIDIDVLRSYANQLNSGFNLAGDPPCVEEGPPAPRITLDFCLWLQNNFDEIKLPK